MTTRSTLKVNLHQLLKAMIEKGASDMHITTGSPPLLRIDGQHRAAQAAAARPRRDASSSATRSSPRSRRSQFEKTNELDLSFGVKGLSRFRANVFMQRGAVAGAFRTIPFKILTFEELGPAADRRRARAEAERPRARDRARPAPARRTTLAAIIDKINTEQRCHIMTIEDPIEYLHPHKLSIVNQREVGTDTEGFKNALKYVLRQDPDVVLVGEMRDLETIEAALTISETGHLVFATLHTNSAVSTINRIIDVFPPHQQEQIRAKLSFVLQGVVSQQLLPRTAPAGPRAWRSRSCSRTPPIRNLIREDKVHQIYTQMQVGQDKYGMQTLNQACTRLFQRRLITLEEAMNR